MRFWLFFLSFLILAPAVHAEGFATAQPEAQADMSSPPAGEEATQPPEKIPYVIGKLTSMVTGVGVGTSVPLALGLRVAPGWKTYWRTPGESGLAPRFDWTGSENLKSFRVYWPAPHRYVMDNLDNYVYEGAVVFPIDAELREATQPLKLKLKLDLLVCKDICVPETLDLALDVPAAPAEKFGEGMPTFGAAVQSIPVRSKGAFLRAYLNYDSANINYLVVEMRRDQRPGPDADLFVEHESGIVFGRPKTEWNSVEKILTLRAPAHTQDPYSVLESQLSPGTLTLTFTNGAEERAVEGILPLSLRPASADTLPSVPRAKAMASSAISGFKIAIFAFIGGLILNLMPCVLPVLSLKVLSVLGHGGKESRSEIFASFAASALGILTSFWLLAGFLIALKETVRAIGWGIQFQSPYFLIFLIVVVTAFAASMWGFFDIPLPRFIARNIPAKHEHEPTPMGHFLTGMFATLLATPCTAPFLGTAVGFALARAPMEIFAVFTVIGFGLASPYIALAASPGLFRYLPKPGRWMTVLKKILSLALVATAVWLASVLFTITTTPTLDLGWEKFDEARIAPAVKEGHVVVVDVTADWCLTCKANKRIVLDQADVAAALSAPEIVRLQADWTQQDAEIAAFLLKHGRYGIPFNIVYGPAAPDGIPLPELLSKKDVLNAIAEAAGE